MAKTRVSFSSSQARSSLNPARKGSQVRALYRSCTHARPAGELMYQFVNPRCPNRKTALEYRRFGTVWRELVSPTHILPDSSAPILRHDDHPYGTRRPSHAIVPDPDQRRNPGSDTIRTAEIIGQNHTNMTSERDRPPRDMPCRTRPLSCVLSTPQSRSAHWYRGPR